MVTSEEGFNALQTAWQALQAECEHATPFQTWEWNDAWRRHFGARKRLQVLLFYKDDSDSALVGISPLFMSRKLLTPLRSLAWLGTGNADYMGPLALSEYEAEVAQHLLRYLCESLQGWDMADLRQLPAQSTLLQIAQSEQMPDNALLSIAPLEPCSYVTLPATWEEYAARVGKKLRSNLAYYNRLLHRFFPDTTLTIASAETLPEAMTALFHLHQRRWNARWLPGALGGRRVQAFHREVAARFQERGWLRLHLLYTDGACRAALYCFAYNSRTYYYLGGFALQMARYSPGTVLTAAAIRHAISEGHTSFDFMRGNEAYKQRWLPEQQINHSLLLLRTYPLWGQFGTVTAKLGRTLDRLERYSEQRVKAFAERLGRSR